MPEPQPTSNTIWWGKWTDKTYSQVTKHKQILSPPKWLCKFIKYLYNRKLVCNTNSNQTNCKILKCGIFPSLKEAVPVPRDFMSQCPHIREQASQLEAFKHKISFYDLSWPSQHFFTDPGIPLPSGGVQTEFLRIQFRTLAMGVRPHLFLNLML